MEYLSARPGFFDAHPTKPTRVPSTPSVVTRPPSISSSSGSEETIPQPATFATSNYMRSQTKVNLKPSPGPQRQNPLSSGAKLKPQPNSIPLRPPPGPVQSSPPLRPPPRPAQSAPPSFYRPPLTALSSQSQPSGQPQDTTSDQIQKWLGVWKQFQDQTSRINQSYQSLANAASGSATATAFPTSDPTGGFLSGVDPSNLFTPGGGMATPIDPSSLLMGSMQTGGFDPTGLSYGCTVM